MSAEDPYRWASALRAEGLSHEQALQRMVAGGVEAGLASEILASIERNRPRPRPLRIAFGVVSIGLGVGVLAMTLKVGLAAVLIVGGLLAVVDGLRGKR